MHFKADVVTAANISLEKLYELFRGQGLVITGFPANDFKKQEPGTNEEIQSFCSLNYGVQFPIFSKITVVGADRHPLYSALITAQPKAINVSEVPFRQKLKGYGIEALPEPEITWNFEKFLVSRSGDVVARFAPDTQPDAPELIAAIKAELAK